jgi:AbrB family looped-hinge helix DNA binding protein
MTKTRLTEKSQTTVPKHIRELLGVRPGDEVEWTVVGDQVVLDSRKRVERPMEVFRREQRTVEIDAVRLVRRVREELR